MRNDVYATLGDFDTMFTQYTVEFNRRSQWTKNVRYQKEETRPCSVSPPDFERTLNRSVHWNDRSLSPKQNKSRKEENSLLFRSTYRSMMRDDSFIHDRSVHNDSVLSNTSLTILSPVRADQYAQKDKLFIFTRIKPEEGFVKSCIHIVDNNTLDLIRPGSKQSFHFDRIYGPVNNQDEIWEDVRHTVPIILEGKKKVCFMAFGASDTGKTYTLVIKITTLLIV
jgi:hypothetical protein